MQRLVDEIFPDGGPPVLIVAVGRVLLGVCVLDVGGADEDAAEGLRCMGKQHKTDGDHEAHQGDLEGADGRPRG